MSVINHGFISLIFQSPIVTVCRPTFRFIVEKSYVLPTRLFYVFYMDLRTKRDYFPAQH
jgi:hypothetical protein